MGEKFYNISFAEAQSFLNEFRYKKRSTWSREERVFFKICNFIVLSRKRINKIFESFEALEKLSNKSHYRYTNNDINLIKGIILENFEIRLQSFNKKLSIFKDTDVEEFQSHLNKLKDENIRLENENKRLQFIIENYVKENKLFEIESIKTLVHDSKVKSRVEKTTLEKTKIKFSKDNIKKFLKLWKEGLTTTEIIDVYDKFGKKRRNLDKKIKLNG